MVYFLFIGSFLFIFYQIGRFMNTNLDFISTKSGVRTRGMTTAVDSQVNFSLGFLDGALAPRNSRLDSAVFIVRCQLSENICLYAMTFYFAIRL